VGEGREAGGLKLLKHWLYSLGSEINHDHSVRKQPKGSSIHIKISNYNERWDLEVDTKIESYQAALIGTTAMNPVESLVGDLGLYYLSVPVVS